MFWECIIRSYQKKDKCLGECISRCYQKMANVGECTTSLLNAAAFIQESLGMPHLPSFKVTVVWNVGQCHQVTVHAWKVWGGRGQLLCRSYPFWRETNISIVDWRTDGRTVEQTVNWLLCHTLLKANIDKSEIASCTMLSPMLSPLTFSRATSLSFDRCILQIRRSSSNMTCADNDSLPSYPHRTLYR